MILTESLQVGAFLDGAGLVEEGDEGLVGGLDQEELEGVTVEGNAFEGGDDSVHHGAASNYVRR